LQRVSAHALSRDQLIRAAFRNNNVDTCARVCHSPTGYGLKTTLGTSAGTQDFDSVLEADVVMVIGANPTDAHPVFASRMKGRLREGARLIVLDPRTIDGRHGKTRRIRLPCALRTARLLRFSPFLNKALVNLIPAELENG